MIVHLGVVIIAVAFAASHSFGHRAEFSLKPGESASLAGHRITYLGTRTVQHPNRTSIVADVKVDGDKIHRPALNQFPNLSQAVGTPSVQVGLRQDVYLTLAVAPDKDGPAVIGVVVQPLVNWLWIGGAIMAFGTVLAAWPGRRRRIPTAPASAPVPLAEEEPKVAEVVGA
jgi:cytochrome c-type biogenesis protein CcmF